jgi:hypothetical protein
LGLSGKEEFRLWLSWNQRGDGTPSRCSSISKKCCGLGPLGLPGCEERPARNPPGSSALEEDEAKRGVDPRDIAPGKTLHV